MAQAAAGHFGEPGVGGVRDGNGRTALHFAAQVAQLDVCRLLLEGHRMDVNVQDDHGVAGEPGFLVTPWDGGCWMVVFRRTAACRLLWRCRLL